MKTKLNPFFLISSFLLMVFPFLVFGQTSTQKLTIKIHDPFNNVLIEGAVIDIDARIIDVLPTGDMSMRSIYELKELNINGTTNNKGIYETTISAINKNTFITIRVSKEGYETMVNMATLIEDTESQEVFIEILPDIDNFLFRKEKTRYTQSFDDFIWERKMKLEQEKIDQEYFFNIDQVSPKESGEISKESNAKFSSNCTAFNVPETVYVKGLIDGYRGQCGTSGYTGNINFQDYVAGVIAKEMGSGFPLEALKAQSVASRTYAYNNIEVGSPANCGHAYTPNIPQKCIDAAQATNGIIALYNNNAIKAYYAARCHGDYTRSAGVDGCALGIDPVAAPYCKSVACSGHINCNSTSEPCCTSYNTERKRNETVFGHGVGLCQRGAQGFAEQGWGWESIVNQFYSNITLSCNDCENDINITGTINSGTYASASTITSSGTINTGNNVVFNTRNEIFLNTGFNVNSANNTSFTAVIGAGSGCSISGKNPSVDENFDTTSNHLITKDPTLEIYPNPSSGIVSVSFYSSRNINTVSVKIYDVIGKLLNEPVRNKQYQEAGEHIISMDLSAYPRGIYFCIFTNTEDVKLTKKILIQ